MCSDLKAVLHVQHLVAAFYVLEMVDREVEGPMGEDLAVVYCVEAAWGHLYLRNLDMDPVVHLGVLQEVLLGVEDVLLILVAGLAVDHTFPGLVRQVRAAVALVEDRMEEMVVAQVRDQSSGCLSFRGCRSVDQGRSSSRLIRAEQKTDLMVSGSKGIWIASCQGPWPCSEEEVQATGTACWDYKMERLELHETELN